MYPEAAIHLSLAVAFSEVDVVAVGAVHVEVNLPDVRRESSGQVPHLLEERKGNVGKK